MSENETIFKPLIIKAQQGDSAAYKELLTGVSLFLKNYLRKRIFEKSEIEEVLQEILMAVHKSLHTYDNNKAFMSWLLAITEYKVVDFVREFKKHAVETDLEPLSHFFSGTYADSDLRIDIDRAMNKLPEREKKILTLLKIEGQSAQEVAEKLDLTEANVKVIAHRAYQQLRLRLGMGA